jgi:hypothetical protein
MGLLSGFSIAATFWIVFRLHESGSHPSEAFNYPDGFDIDDSLFLVCIFAWFDGLLPLLIAASFCAPLFLIFASWQYCTLKSYGIAGGLTYRAGMEPEFLQAGGGIEKHIAAGQTHPRYRGHRHFAADIVRPCFTEPCHTQGERIRNLPTRHRLSRFLPQNSQPI